MARFRPKGLGLERVLGVGALFSTAYGDVGSSIYYALGLVAIFALGMTPVVYLIAGVLFVMTAMTYAEATTNFPEAGGSSSFARRAFNELASFFAGWAQILNYVITVAISAFFVPHYLAVFWEPLRHSPGDIIGGIVIVVLLSRGEHHRRARVGAAEPRARGDRLRDAAPAAAARRVPRPQLRHADRQHPSRSRADRGPTSRSRSPVAMISYTGIETISNMSEEAREPRRLIPRAMALVVSR